jgi:hypothetical protein
MGVRETLMRCRPLVRAVQFAVTGEFKPRRWPLLAQAMAADNPEFLVDLGSGASPILEYIRPSRYVSVDVDRHEIARARARYSCPRYEFVCADLATCHLAQWHGADVVALSSVSHHLSDGALRGLIRRINSEIGPRALYLQDASPTGPLAPLVKFLDDGDHIRTEAELIALLDGQFAAELLWTYENPFRSFHQYLFRLTPTRT